MSLRSIGFLCVMCIGVGCGPAKEPRFPRFADDAGASQNTDGGSLPAAGSWSRSGSGSTLEACTPLPNDQCGASSAWEERINLSPTAYQQTFDDLTGRGYRLVQLNGYAAGSETRYAAIWQQCTGAAWQARHGMTRSQLQATFDELTATGYRPVHISGYTVAGVDRFAGIWVQRTGSAWQSRHDLSPAEFQQVFNQLSSSGHRLARLAVYGTPSAPRYAALWEQCAAPPWEARHGLTSSEHQQAVETLLAQGYRPAQVGGPGPGEERYSAIWEKRSFPAWQARHGLTSTQFQQAFNDLLGQGYRPIDVSGVSTANGTVFNGIWTK